MPFTPPVTFANAAAFTAADVLASNDALREYVEKLEDSAFSAGPFVDTQHIMRGQFLPTINRAHMVSGIYEGHVYTFGANNFTYATTFNTLRLGTNISEYVPLTAMTLDIRHPATLLHNWWAHPIGRYNADGSATGVANIIPFLGNATLGQVDKTVRSIEEAEATANFPYRNQRYSLSGQQLVETVGPALGYGVGLLARVTPSFAKCQFISWGVSCEVFHL